MKAAALIAAACLAILIAVRMYRRRRDAAIIARNEREWERRKRQ